MLFCTSRVDLRVTDVSTIGVAIKIDDDLFVAWGDKGHPFGIVSYIFDGECGKGVWTLGGASRTGMENLVKQ